MSPPLLLGIYCVLLLYGTLKPFQFTWHPARDRLLQGGHTEWVPFTHLCPNYGIFCPQQIGLNIAIFIPMGLMIPLLAPRVTSPLRRIAIAATAGFAISLSIETAQYFIPVRVPSSTDLILNTLGAVLGGAFIAYLVRSPIPAAHDPAAPDCKPE